MIRDTPAYQAGYEAARVPTDSLVRAIEPPAGYSDAELQDYISGFLLGSRDARNRELMDEWDAEDAGR
jgi:hypothetical protein